jgi:hypothetical protein
VTDWFLAGENEADAVASIASGERSFDEWPHLSVPLHRAELAVLHAALTEPAPTDGPLPPGLLAVEVDEGMIVTRVPAPVVEALAEMTPRTAPRVIDAWSAGIDHREPDALGEILTELAAFARAAAETGRPVLELSPY